MSQWIRSQDRKPPLYELVLIYPRPTDYCMEAMYTNNGWTYGEYEPYNGHVEHPCNPTHWQPSPEPPGEQP